MSNNHLEVFQSATKGVADKPFSTTLNRQHYTYIEAWRTAHRLACVLWRTGIAPGQRIAVQVELDYPVR